MANKRRHISDINEILDYVTNDIDSDMDMDLGESDFEDDAESLEYESEVEDGHEVEEETNIEMTTDSQVGILMVDEPVENNNFIIVDEDNHVFEAENIDIPGGEVSSEAEEEQADKILPPTTSPTHPNRSNLNHPNNNNAMQSAERNLDVNVADDDIIADDNISHSDNSEISEDDDDEAAEVPVLGRGGRVPGGGVRVRGVRVRGCGVRVRGRNVRVRGGGVGARGGGVRRGGVGIGAQGGRARGAGRARRRGGRLPAGRAAARKNPLHWSSIEKNEVEVFKNFDKLQDEGLKVRLRDNASLLDYVELYLTDSIINTICVETNRFANKCLQDLGDDIDESYLRHWEDVAHNELKTFIGLLLLMGIIYKPSIRMYWSLDTIYSTPIFSQVMKRDRFELIMKFLHFNDNSTYDATDEDRDRLHKVRPLIDGLRERCRKVYYPGKNLSVDESLVLFKGRLHFKQFIRTKRARFGIKLFELCTSSGITLDLLVYCGKGMFSDDDLGEDMPHSERIPALLMEPFLHNNHTLHTDNYYTSPALAKYFLENGTHLCGTVRSNRQNFPKQLVAEQLPKGDASFYKCNEINMVACKFRASKDKADGKPKVVYMLSTLHQPTMREATVGGIPTTKPVCVKAYNQHMGGVDKVDQQLHGLRTLRKTYKWYKKLALRLITQVVLNAHKVYQFETGSNMVFLDFVHDTISLMLALTPKVATNCHIVPIDSYARLTERHFPSVKQAAPNAKDQRPTKPCRVCHARGVRTDRGKAIKTIYVCNMCPSEPGLHPDTCFMMYHTMLDFALE